MGIAHGLLAIPGKRLQDLAAWSLDFQNLALRHQVGETCGHGGWNLEQESGQGHDLRQSPYGDRDNRSIESHLSDPDHLPYPALAKALASLRSDAYCVGAGGCRIMHEFDLDHIGIAVHSIDEGVAFYQALGLELTETEEVPEQGVRVGFIPIGTTRIELLEPLGAEGPIARHLERRGAGLHHLCVRVGDIKAAMRRLADAGYRLLSGEPQPGAHGCLVCFVHPKDAGGVLIELSQSSENTDSSHGGP